MNKIGLYIHIPFCKSKCAYCAFTSFKCTDKINAYINALKEELAMVLNKNIIIDTLYIGGGTPSILLEEQIEDIINTIKQYASFEAREVTIECNPESITYDKIAKYKDIGIDRISMGVQSINDKTLKIIGRIHRADEAIAKAKMIKDMGFNLSVDMILGLPSSTLDDIEKFIDTFSDVGVNHISAYSLSVEEGTPLDKMVKSKTIVLPTEDDQIDQYDYAYDLLKARGYNRYEVSNFAKAEFESKHNNKYWQMDEYIGVGLASHSFFNGKRYYNTKVLDEYIEQINKGVLPRTIDETLTLRDRVEETIMLGLRLSKGVSIAKLNELIGDDFLKVNRANLEKVKDYINISNEYMNIKDEYMNVMNSIIVDIIS